MPSTIIAIAIFLQALLGTASPPPSQPFTARTWQPTLDRSPAQGLNLGRLAIRFEETTLGSVEGAVKVGAISHRGDAGESIYWLCYTIAVKPRPQRVWIVADGEMGGDEHSVTSVIAAFADTAATDSCPLLPAKFLPVALTNSIWIGTIDAKVTDVLGPPSHIEGAWRSYDFDTKIPGKCEGGFDLSNWLLTFSGRKGVEKLFAGQVTSC